MYIQFAQSSVRLWETAAAVLHTDEPAECSERTRHGFGVRHAGARRSGRVRGRRARLESATVCGIQVASCARRRLERLR